MEELFNSCEDESGLREQAERSRQIISAIFDSTQSFIILIGLDYNIVFYNKKALDMSKLLYGTDLRIGDNFLNFKRKGDEEIFDVFKDNFMKAVARGTMITCERKMCYHDLDRWIRTEFTPVYDSGAIIGVALRIVDITERKQKEIRIEQQHEQLRQISWIQSHLTRQPISTILGLIGILDKSELSDENLKIITLLEKTVAKLDEVIRSTVIHANALEQFRESPDIAPLTK